MLSLTTPVPKPTLSNLHRYLHRRRLKPLSSSSSSRRLPSPPPPSLPGADLYQPFRSSPSPLPSMYRSLDPAQRIGITDVEQNRLAVAPHVCESLARSSPELLPSFDHASAADFLYELRLLNSVQRASAARYAVANNLDARSAQELARAIKGFPRRRGDDGWGSFSADSPADCLAYTYFCLSREAIDRGEKLSWLEKGLDIAETDDERERFES